MKNINELPVVKIMFFKKNQRISWKKISCCYGARNNNDLLQKYHLFSCNIFIISLYRSMDFVFATGEPIRITFIFLSTIKV